MFIRPREAANGKAKKQFSSSGLIEFPYKSMNEKHERER